VAPDGNVHQETALTLQLLGLLFLYPLSSAELFVKDVLWFIRHHYAFFDSLKHAGYVRLDPLNPGIKLMA